MEEFLTASGAKRPVDLTWSEDKRRSASGRILLGSDTGETERPGISTGAEVTSDSEWLVPGAGQDRGQ
ncbi:MAG: hypothetical protein V8S96_09150 [Lachnospiraceae bacterium]